MAPFRRLRKWLRRGLRSGLWGICDGWFVLGHLVCHRFGPGHSFGLPRQVIGLDICHPSPLEREEMGRSWNGARMRTGPPAASSHPPPRRHRPLEETRKEPLRRLPVQPPGWAKQGKWQGCRVFQTTELLPRAFGKCWFWIEFTSLAARGFPFLTSCSFIFLYEEIFPFCNSGFAR